MSDYDYRDEGDEGLGCLKGCIWVFVIVVVLMVPLLASCDTPRHKSPAEIRHENQVQHAKEVKAKRDAAAKARLEAAQKRAAEKEKLAKMPSVPPGIEQMDSVHFYVHHGFEGNTRDLCRTSKSGSAPGIEAIVAAPNGSQDMIVICNNPEHEYKHETLHTAPITTTPQSATTSK